MPFPLFRAGTDSIPTMISTAIGMYFYLSATLEYISPSEERLMQNLMQKELNSAWPGFRSQTKGADQARMVVYSELFPAGQSALTRSRQTRPGLLEAVGSMIRRRSISQKKFTRPTTRP